MDNRIKNYIRVTGVTLIIGYIDYITGDEIRLYPFYFIPIAMMARDFGRMESIFFSILSALVWFAANYLGGTVYSSNWIWVWNTAVQAAGLVAVAFMIEKITRLLEVEQKFARTDALTGLLNRFAFYEILPAVLGLCRRSDQPVSLAYMDLDNFKKVNDEFGHKRGDEILASVAKLLKTQTRVSDIAARLGGDEFAILLPNCDQQSASEVLGRIVSNVQIQMTKSAVDITASIGAVTFKVDDRSAEKLLLQADKVMYKVKNSGKNSIIVELI